jgi:phosphoglycolate phosphatase-like HAD superfamily hydrolase
LDVFGARPEDCLMIGDSAPDMQAGRRAGVKICGVRYGYGNLEQMSQCEPDYWIDDIRDLIPSSETYTAHAAQDLQDEVEA